MSDDLTRKLPGDKEPIAPQDDDRITAIINAVQSLSANLQPMSADLQEIKVRIESIETTAAKRSLETKPIWERALAEIAETRIELAETRAELKGEIADLRAELKGEIAGVRAELGETRAELKGEIADVRADLAGLRADLAETKADLTAEMKDGFRKLAVKIQLLTEDSLTLRGDQRQLERRVEALEPKSP